MKTLTIRRIIPAFIILLISLQGCAFAKHDGPPLADIDVSAIPDALPKFEPLSQYGNMPVYHVKHHYYRTLKSSKGFSERGVASWYGKLFHAHRTSSGEVYNMYAMTAAHKSLPLPTYVRVTNLNNGRQIIVKVNDRGPFHGKRIIDLSYVAAKKLGILSHGTGQVQIDAIDPNEYYAAQNSLARTIVDQQPKHSASGEDDEIIDEDTLEEATLSNTPLDVHIVLQAGAFANHDKASYQATQVAQITDRPVQLVSFQTDNGTYYRVQIGPITSINLSEKLQAQIEAAGLGETYAIVQ